MINVKAPGADELAYIKKISKHDPRVKVRLRADILLMGWNGFHPGEIVLKLGCAKNTVYKWLKTWNMKGIGAVVMWRQTSSWYLQVKRRKAMEKLATTSPASLDLLFNTWSVVKLAAFMTDLVEYPISSTTVWRDLKTLGITYKKVQDTFWLKPVDYGLKRAWLRWLEHFCPPSWRIVYVDEKGPVHALRYSGHKWSFNRCFRDIRQETRGKVLFLGGFDPVDYQLEMFAMESDSSYSFRETMDLIRMTFLTEQYTHLLVVLDNDPIHAAKATVDYFDDDSQMDYFFLPAYSPELNPVEICFHHYTGEFLNNGTFTSAEEIIEGTTAYCQFYRTLRREIHAS